MSAYHIKPPQLPIAVEGFPFISVSLILVFFAFVFGMTWLGTFLTLLTGFIVYFFRNPERKIPSDEGLVVSPADGRVLCVVPCEDTPLLGGPSQRVSIFLSVFNVHINRSPIAAKVKKVAYHAGKFFVASLDKACVHNERNTIALESSKGSVVMSQVAGLVARRIVCYLKEGDDIARGDRLGLIRFGSRVDLFLPANAVIDVKAGDCLKGGASIIGRFA
ncbi:MAG: phosphatidylserine decarboxylase family protein [Deltaproteobacteria bacterium]|nr:phosphatidylserine decarboxylase family protein [Deltaproteobacteria bacterium]